MSKLGIKYPGPVVALWTTLWILLSVSVLSMTYQQPGFGVLVAVYAIPFLASMLIWLDIRKAKWLLAAYWAVMTGSGIIRFITGEVEWRAAFFIALTAYWCFVMLRWDGGPKSS